MSPAEVDWKKGGPTTEDTQLKEPATLERLPADQMDAAPAAARFGPGPANDAVATLCLGWPDRSRDVSPYFLGHPDRIGPKSVAGGIGGHRGQQGER